MIAWRAGVVTECRARWDGACESTVAIEGEDRTVRALSYPHLVGEVVPGARVLLNATALLRGLGTGGYALVVARTDSLVPDPLPGPGHLVKARYTPLQAMVLGVDDQESAHHEVLREADDLAGLPVVVADLHSALPAVVAGARAAADRLGRPAPRVAYVMTDGGALPAWFSRAVDGLRSAGWLQACVTVGQAFGGDLEAVTVHTGLLAARHVVGADLVVVAQGPGNLGTGTRWGFSGVAAGEALNAAGVLGGRPVASLRVSGADARDRHLGVSHHSLTAYGRVALLPADVVVPEFAPDLPGTPQDLTADPDPAAWAAFGARVAAQADGITAPAGRHTAVRVDAGTALLDALRTCPVRLSTMGRGLDADPAAFLAAAVAGAHAVTAG
ncbi:DUF3866 family protein [Cellulomonas sp. zg-ZUI222]|uniref:DUF3866 family protein n=1 Tax=Cellulomonas wangleii TaxID=2816956 RepID=UPI001A94EC4E|nr:DUF3866 family protein [Cellulomonas wangleii]MBO0920751.1 DUF3866 family protein [Cellulomonas wangleii]